MRLTPRDLIALPLYVLGAILWILAVVPLFIADFISGKNHSQWLLRL